MSETDHPPPAGSVKYVPLLIKIVLIVYGIASARLQESFISWRDP
jgi:hypothetical protein